MRIFHYFFTPLILLTLVLYSPDAFSKRKPASSDGDSTSSFDDQLGQNSCYGSALGTLTSWSPEYHWERQPDDEVFEKIFISSIDPVGAFVWIGQNIKTKVLEARKSGPDGNVQVDWIDPDCTPHTKLYPGTSTSASQDKDGFDDQDLSKLLKTSPKGVIFAYSDRMHLSVDAKATLQKIGSSLGVPVLFLADPESPTMTGKKLESSELIARGMTLHYPSMLVYAHGKITSPLMPGYKVESVYSAFIEEYIK
jgi:hypothetical protein